jgi:hypothetical protein
MRHAIAFVIVALVAVTVASTTRAGDGRTLIVCRNTSSGAAWSLTIDLAKSTVDSYPAEISEDAIRWRDSATSASYDLDRQSGALTATFPSSTGGYFLHHRCDLQPLKKKM